MTSLIDTLRIRKLVNRDLFASESGAAMVEFAIVTAFIVVPLIFGIIEFGRETWAKTTITAAAREGVRFAIVHGSFSGALPSDTAAIRIYVGTKAQLTPIGVKTTYTPANNNDPGSQVAVKVTYNYVPLVPFLAPKTLQSTSTQIIAF